jgi:hypothetical protein
MINFNKKLILVLDIGLLFSIGTAFYLIFSKIVVDNRDIRGLYFFIISILAVLIGKRNRIYGEILGIGLIWGWLLFWYLIH